MSTDFQSKNQELIAKAIGPKSVTGTTRAQILEAYVKIAVKEGTTALSLTRLAEELGISKQLVRYHVSDLDQAALELFKITAQSGGTYIQTRLEQSRSWNEKLRTWHEANFDWFVAYPEFGKFLLFMYHRASVDAEVRELHEKIVNTGRKRIEEILSISTSKKIKKDAELLACILHQCITSSIIEMLSLDDLKNHNAYRKKLQQSINYVLEF